ncbi:MAG: ROK family protein [Candidatus Saccharimonadales bacterium]
MYLAVDIGGTKTLLAAFTDSGELIKQLRFETSKNYKDFLHVFKDKLEELGVNNFKAGVVAVPGRLDRQHGRALGYGTLEWGPAPVEQDIEAIANCPISIENDAKLAGLSEAILIKNEFKRVLYVTIGTGISDAVIMNGILDPAFLDSEGGQIWLEHNGKKLQWEDIASGSAIFKKYGKQAGDIQDQAIWQAIAGDIAIGLIDLIVIVQPEVIIIGGGVGSHFDLFQKPLLEKLQGYQTELTPIPPIRQAQRPEEAVIYGCFELIKQRYGHHFKKAD